jgi:hypothetical protein
MFAAPGVAQVCNQVATEPCQREDDDEDEDEDDTQDDGVGAEARKMDGYSRFPTAPSPGGLFITTIVSLRVVLAALDRLQHSLQLRALPGCHVARVYDDVRMRVRTDDGGRCAGLASIAFRDHLPARLLHLSHLCNRYRPGRVRLKRGVRRWLPLTSS